MRPNILLILSDDMGYSDIGCYGGEVMTPHLDRLAAEGMRFTQFYNTARCSPSRASLLTGLHPHQTGIGILTDDDGPGGYPGTLNRQCVTLAEVLKESGYRTYMSGKWHLANKVDKTNDAWPRQRGFDRFCGTLNGAGSYYDPKTLTRDNDNIEHVACENENFYYTDAISDWAVQWIQEHASLHPERPFFQYVAYTAPHWPLQALEQDIAKYRGRFDEGWHELRKARFQRMKSMGLLAERWKLSESEPDSPAWADAENKEWLLRCMEVYAAQIDRMDQGIGRILKALEATGQRDNTVILFLSDNGGCDEAIHGERLVRRGGARASTRQGNPVQFGAKPEVMPGPENTYQSYGRAWANLSNTPFRKYKHWVHEGGIATPFIAWWPSGIQEPGSLCHAPCYLPDIMTTVLDISGASYPEQYGGNRIHPPEGISLKPRLQGHADGHEYRMLYWEHEGNAAVRWQQWKLVRDYPGPWELYNMERDRTETVNLAASESERVLQMSRAYERWAERCGVIPREQILKLKGS